MKIDTLLRQEIEKELGELSRIELGTEQYESTVNGVTKLLDRAIEMQKFDADRDDRLDSQERDYKLKLQQMSEDRKDRFWKNVLTALGIAIPTGVTVWGTLKSLKFEETGTITTVAGRSFISNLFRKK